MNNLDKWLKNSVGEGKKIVSGNSPKRSFFKRRPHAKHPNHKKQAPHASKHPSLRIIPLGGLEEVGKNMTVFEYGRDIFILDMGFQFPEDDMLGVDYVIPDISYLEDKIDRIRGIFITHGHLDHTGGIPYFFPKLGNIPIFGTKLTMGLVRKRLEEFGYAKVAKLNTIDPDETLRLGCFTLNFFRVNHSIPDGVGVIIDTPQGKVVHTGDFKFDFTPADNKLADFSKIAALSGQNVIALMSDSTNALNPGHTVSEKSIGKTLDDIIKNTPGRIIIASFSSLIGRIQQIVSSAIKHQRPIYVSGRSMVDNIEIATKLGYLSYPKGTIRDIRKYKNHGDPNALILTTGSQGEAVSALTRMAAADHPHIKIKKNDTIVLSSSPIIGNEKAITATINNLCYLGANVISNNIMDVHTSGHGKKEDLKLMLSLVKPKNLIPVHGLLYMRKAHGQLGIEMGLKEENIIYADNGSVIEINNEKVKLKEEKVESKYVIVDGLGIGDTSATVIKERQEMAENGIAIVLFKADKTTKKLIKTPMLISRGFLYLKETDKIEKEIVTESKKAYEALLEKDPKASWDDLKKFVAGSIARNAHKQLDRRPLVLPIIVTG
ncbi:ribonuclease J [Patescibacteria group bacterium]|nr:ribonuclease J [Patescibacteria group bacterium]